MQETRQASGQHQNQKNIVAKLTETKAKTHHHPKISLQPTVLAKPSLLCRTAANGMAVGCSCAGCLLFLNILFNWHHCSLSGKSCRNATVGLCHGTVAILCLS